MGRWGLAELPAAVRERRGLMSHLATADSDPAFARQQIERFREATEPYAHLTRHIANSARGAAAPGGAFRRRPLRDRAATGSHPSRRIRPRTVCARRCRWRSRLAQVRLLQPGESTGYGRRFVAGRPTWIGIVPVGYADGFRRDMSGTEVLVDGERRRAIGTVSMDAVAVELDRELPVGTPVTIIGDGVLIEQHARGRRDDRLRDRLRDQRRFRARPARRPSTDRFARTAERVAARQDARAARLAEEVRDFVQPRGDERALDVGTGAGALAFALAPFVREVVGLDPVPELLELALERARCRTPSSSRETGRRCRSRTAPSTSPARTGRSITSRGPSSSSPSSPG